MCFHTPTAAPALLFPSFNFYNKIPWLQTTAVLIKVLQKLGESCYIYISPTSNSVHIGCKIIHLIQRKQYSSNEYNKWQQPS